MSHLETNKEEVIKNNLRLFLPYIIQCVPATQLLTHLQYYDRGQRKEIFRKSCERPHQATEMALQILLDKTDEEGQFTALMDALDISGYPKIVNILSGKYVPNDLYEERILQLFTHQIIQQLQPVQLLYHLVKYGVIGDEEKENVHAEDINHGAIRASFVLLAFLPSRIEDWFKYFLMALIDCGHADLAETLEPDLFLKIMAQKKAEGHDVSDDTKQDSDVRENILYVEETQDDDLLATENKPGEVQHIPVTKESSTLTIVEEIDINELLDDNSTDLAEKESIEEDEKCTKSGDAHIGKNAEVAAANLPEVNKHAKAEGLLTENTVVRRSNDIGRSELGEDTDSVTKVKLISSLDREDNQDDFIRYDRQFLLSLRQSPLANYIPRQVLKYPEISVISPQWIGNENKAQKKTGNHDALDDIKQDLNVGENILYVEETQENDLLATSNKPDEGNHIPITKESKTLNSVEEIDFNELLDYDSTDLVEKETIEENEKCANSDGAQDDINKEVPADTHVGKNAEVVATELNNLSEEINQYTKAEGLLTGKNGDRRNHYVGQGEVGVDTDNVTEVKFMSCSDMADKQDNFIRYDRQFLLSLRQSPLANYVPRQVLRYPEISVISPEWIGNGHHGEVIVGARPKVRTVNLAREEITQDTKLDLSDNATVDVVSINKQQFVNDLENVPMSMNDLENVFDDLLLGDISLEDNDDLEIIYNRAQAYDQQTDLDYNIKTDNDDIDGVEDADVDLRGYQRELAKEGIDGENVIIMAPTNSGKTRVAIRIVQEHLRRQKREGKIASVIFLVQDETLAIQQGKEFAARLPAYRTKIISGSTQRDKHEYLKDFVDRRDILVVTAQVLINSLISKANGEIRDLTRFTMMVFDECHHANKKHPYNQILSKYLDLKIIKNTDINQLPQIVGMTASLGCGGNLDATMAKNHMKQVMANMDAKCLCTIKRRENLEELKQYVNPPIEKTVQVKNRSDDGFGRTVNQIMDQIDQLMVSYKQTKLPDIRNIVPDCRGTEQFLQWLAKFKEDVAKADKDEARLMNPCRLHLEAYNMALLIYKDARVKDAARIIDRFNRYYKLLQEKDSTDDFLLDLYEDFKQLTFDAEAENPKLIEIKRILLDVLEEENARGIIFVKTRQLASALINWMNETEELQGFKAEEFVGQAAASYKGGSTKSRQIDIMEYFRGGRHKVVVATSVLEEGIDVSKCNLVIRYEHVTNEIVRLQSRGRARATDSKYFVLTQAGSWIVEKEEKNRQLEELMNRLVPRLQQEIEENQNGWEFELRAIQQELKDKDLAEQKKREEGMIKGSISIQCLNCQIEICKSTEIVLLQKSHHIIIGKEAAKKFLYFPSPVPEFVDEDIQYHGRIQCVKCFHTLGGICQYKHTQFPLLKIGQWRDQFGLTYKKWKKVPYEFEDFTLDDLRDVVIERQELLDLD